MSSLLNLRGLALPQELVLRPVRCLVEIPASVAEVSQETSKSTNDPAPSTLPSYPAPRVVTVGGFFRVARSIVGVTVADPFLQHERVVDGQNPGARDRARSLKEKLDIKFVAALEETPTGLTRSEDDFAEILDGQDISFNKAGNWIVIAVEETSLAPRSLDSLSSMDSSKLKVGKSTDMAGQRELHIETANRRATATACKAPASREEVLFQGFRAWKLEIIRGELSANDRGSWVLDPIRHKVWGIVIGKNGRHVYVTPLYEILLDILPLSRWTKGETTLDPEGLRPAGETAKTSPSSPRKAQPFGKAYGERIANLFFQPNSTYVPSTQCRDDLLFSRANGIQFWVLEPGGSLQQKWTQEVLPRTEIIIQRSPSEAGGGIMPILLLYGMAVGKDDRHAHPSVVVVCESKGYRKQILRTFARDRVLQDKGFRLVALEQLIRTTSYGVTAS